MKKWYQIDNGPRDWYQLAQKLKRPMEYEVFYRVDSAIVHATNSEKMLSNENPGTLNAIRPGEFGLQPEVLLSTTATLLNFASLQVAKKLRPEESVHEQIQEILRLHRPELYVA